MFLKKCNIEKQRQQITNSIFTMFQDFQPKLTDLQQIYKEIQLMLKFNQLKKR